MILPHPASSSPSHGSPFALRLTCAGFPSATLHIGAELGGVTRLSSCDKQPASNRDDKLRMFTVMVVILYLDVQAEVIAGM